MPQNAAAIPAATPSEYRKPGMMTQLNNVLIDGADDGDIPIPSQLKKVAANFEVNQPQASPLPPGAPEKNADDDRQISHEKTNEMIAKKLAEANKNAPPDREPSVTHFEVCCFL